MDRGRAARGGQKPPVSTTRLIRGYSLRINVSYTTRPRLCSIRERTEMLVADQAREQEAFSYQLLSIAGELLALLRVLQ